MIVDWRNYESARKFVRSLGLNGQKEWLQFCKSGKKPNNIPVHPDRNYKNKGWKGFGDWLGTGTIANVNKEFRDFEDARKFVRSLGLKSFSEWREYSKSNNKPYDIPAGPNNNYKNKGWKGWGDWLGTDTIASKNKKFLSFEDARKFVRSLGIKNQKEWRDYCNSGNKPDNIPTNPWEYYSKKRSKNEETI